MNQNQQQYEREQQQIISEAKHHIYELHNAMKKLDQNHINQLISESIPEEILKQFLDNMRSRQ